MLLWHFYWNRVLLTINGRSAGSQVLIVFPAPGTIASLSRKGPIVYISSLLSWIVATNRPIVLFLPLPESAPHWQATHPPSTGIPSNSQRDQCCSTCAKVRRLPLPGLVSQIFPVTKFFFVCEAENLSKLGSQAAGMVPLRNYSLCPPQLLWFLPNLPVPACFC